MAALLTGLLGATHCIGMCGSISAALSLSFPKEVLYSAPNRLLHLLFINLGRTSGYVSFGAVAGAIGSASTAPLQPQPALWVSQTVTVTVLVMLGFYYLGYARLLGPLERLGHFLWRRIQPYTFKFQPGRTIFSSFSCGYLWAFMPCGMIYSTLALAFVAGDLLSGAKIMLVFGAATLPTLMSAGFFSAELDKLLQQTWVRRVAGLSLFAFAIYVLVR